MTEERRLHVTRGMAAAALLSTLLAGAGGMYLWTRSREAPAGAGANAPAADPRPSAAAASPAARPPAADAVVTLTRDAADRAGIVVTQVSAGPAADSLRLPGVVEPNAYRQVTVTPLVGGRVVSVAAQLGERVRKGQPLARVYSPELAEARSKYVAARSMLEAHDRELQRTGKLVEIGAASRQELERLHAEHAAQLAEVESARSRLRLLGADAERAPAPNAQDAATASVPAPIDGVVTERAANAGLNVDPATKLFTIVDLSQVWIVADVYERDLQRIREGARATVTSTAFPERPLEGRVSFIDPQLNPATRTARLRVEAANPRGDLRLGMYADVAIESASAASVLTVPKEAVQTVGDRQVVYVSLGTDPPRFVEREVRLGRVLGDRVEILGGLTAGDAVASKGSFFLRAEAERLGIRAARPSSPAARTPQAASPAVQVAKVAVTEKGFEPARVTLRAGAPARLTFVRTTDKTCATEVAFPSLGIRRGLPLNDPVVIDFTPSTSGEVAFVCGMNMLKGTVVVQ